MDIILWRHAEAEDAIPGRILDLERALTPHGRKQARKMADWLLVRLPADCLILASPARRTQQTAGELERPFTTAAKIGPNASAKDLLEVAGWDAGDRNTVLVVGHQPTLGEVASHLLCGHDGGTSIKKGAILWISGRPEGNRLKVALAPSLV